MNFATTPTPDHSVLETVAVRHIVDGLTSGSDEAAVLARSLMTELEIAGVPVDALVEDGLTAYLKAGA